MRLQFAGTTTIILGGMLAASASGASIYNNLTPNNLVAVASRPASGVNFEIETGDDFVLGSQTTITSASFVGLIVPGTGGNPGISAVAAEIYRVFPLDSDTTRAPHVPTRANSPSDDALDTRGSAANELTYTTSLLAPVFTALNSVQPGGIHPSPLQATTGNGPLTGQEVQFTLTFTTPFDLQADHYFFVPQVQLTDGAQFYWLSASRPITGAGTTPFPAGAADLQAWTRDAGLDPDWLRVGTDIVGGTTFNAAFSLEGTTAPEPTTTLLVVAGLGLVAGGRRWSRRGKQPVR